MPSTAVPIADAAPAAPWRRLAAMGYDLLPLLGLWIIAAGLWMLVFRAAYAPTSTALAVPLRGALRALLQVWLLAVAGAYFVVSWVRVGATIGMRAWKIRLVRDDGARLGVRTAVLRFALALVSLAALGCGFWYAWFDPDRRAWHDRVCGTRVTRL